MFRSFIFGHFVEFCIIHIVEQYDIYIGCMKYINIVFYFKLMMKKFDSSDNIFS